MAEVVLNRKNHSAVVHAVANATLNVAGSNTSESDIYLEGENEILGATISKLFWGAANGEHWEVDRGGNTVLVLPESGAMDFAGEGMAITKDDEANLGLTLSGGDGFIMLELKKNGTQRTD